MSDFQLLLQLFGELKRNAMFTDGHYKALNLSTLNTQLTISAGISNPAQKPIEFTFSEFIFETYVKPFASNPTQALIDWNNNVKQGYIDSYVQTYNPGMPLVNYVFRLMYEIISNYVEYLDNCNLNIYTLKIVDF